MTNTELRKQSEKYIEENNILFNTYAIEKAFIDGAKFLRDKSKVNNGVLDRIMCECDDKNYSTPEKDVQKCFECKKKIDCV